MRGAKHKNLMRMKNLIGKFKREGSLARIFCASMGLTTKVFMLFDQHRKFIRWDLDSNVLSPAEPELLVAFASQALSLSSYITGDRELRAAA